VQRPFTYRLDRNKLRATRADANAATCSTPISPSTITATNKKPALSGGLSDGEYLHDLSHGHSQHPRLLGASPARCVVRAYSPLPVLAGGAARHHHSSGNADMPYFGMFLG
jgi:hypothetical protein